MKPLFLVSLLGLLAGFSVNSYSAPAADAQLAVVNLPDLNGRQRDLIEWRGKVLVVNFWATWCPPCREEIPEFVELQTTMGERGLQFVGVAIEAREPVAAFAQKYAVNYPMLIAGDDGIQLTLDHGNSVGGLPYSLIVDRDGLIRHRIPGRLHKERLLELVEPLL